jgi:ABC-type phosphate transport system substrate-binding protein
MRRLAFVGMALAVAALLVAGCGGGSGSSSGSGSASATTAGEGAGASATAAWEKELTGVMTDFENEVSAHAVEEINTTTAQHLLEPLYRNYAIDLEKLSDNLEATKAPAACAAVQKKIVDDGRADAQLTKQLSHRTELNEEEFAGFAAVQREKIKRYGGELTELTFDPGC